MSVYLRLMLDMSFVAMLMNYNLGVVLNRLVVQMSILRKVVLGITSHLQSLQYVLPYN